MWLMREQEAARLKFLRRKLLEELEAAEKIFVYRFERGRFPRRRSCPCTWC